MLKSHAWFVLILRLEDILLKLLVEVKFIAK